MLVRTMRILIIGVEIITIVIVLPITPMITVAIMIHYDHHYNKPPK